MHADPGPYWDWAHYFDLLGAPLQRRSARPTGGLVTILPDYDRTGRLHRLRQAAGRAVPAARLGAVRLHTEPREDAPLVKDIGKHPAGELALQRLRPRRRAPPPASVRGRRAPGRLDGDLVPGPEGVVPEPGAEPAAVPAVGLVVTPRPGLTAIPVYGRAYPEPEAYPAGVPVQAVSPLPYKLPAGQRYTVGLTRAGRVLLGGHLRHRAARSSAAGAVLPDPVRPPGDVRQGRRREGVVLLEGHRVSLTRPASHASVRGRRVSWRAAGHPDEVRPPGVRLGLPKVCRDSSGDPRGQRRVPLVIPRAPRAPRSGRARQAEATRGWSGTTRTV